MTRKMNNNKKTKVCLISSCGGHFMELMQLLPLVKDKLYYIVTEKRLAICSTCSYKTKLCGQDICDLCGCVLDAKVRVEDEQCYNNKW